MPELNLYFPLANTVSLVHVERKQTPMGKDKCFNLILKTTLKKSLYR